MTIKKYMLFFTPMCPKCPKIKDYMKDKNLEKEWVDATIKDGLDKAREFKVMAVPTVIFFDQDDKEVSRASNLDEVKKIIENKTLADI